MAIFLRAVKAQVMYIARVDPGGHTEWARIGRVAVSKTGRTLSTTPAVNFEARASRGMSTRERVSRFTSSERAKTDLTAAKDGSAATSRSRSTTTSGRSTGGTFGASRIELTSV
jgi:hypothetical protein